MSEDPSQPGTSRSSRAPRRPLVQELHDADRTTITVFGLLALLGAAVWIAGLVTGSNWQVLGLELTRWSQERLYWMTTFMAEISRFTGRSNYLYLGALIYWSAHRRTGLIMLVAVLIGSVLAGALKLLIASPRPLFLDPELGLGDQDTFGMPSGHVLNAVVVWGALATMIRRRWAWAAAVAIVLAVSASRIHLGAHFPTDVLAGWILGGVALVSLVVFRAPLIARLEHMTRKHRLVSALAVSVMIVVGGWLAAAHLDNWEPPAHWVGFEEDEVPVALEGLDGIVLSAGVILGLAAGDLVLGRRRSQVWECVGGWHVRLGRGVLGLAGLFLLVRGVGALLPPLESQELLVPHYLQGILVGAWITGLAPRLFHRTNLVGADSGTEPGE